MRFVLMLLPACLCAQGDLTGSWINEKSETAGVTQVTLRRDGNRMLAHVWGSCRPVDCDWGEADVELWNGVPMAIWKPGFSTVRMQFIPQPDGRMLLAYRSEYHDDSGRRDLGQAEYFARKESIAEPADAAGARAVLRAVGEAYRQLPSAYFEAVETEYRKVGKSEIRNITRTKAYFSAPDKVRSERAGDQEPVVQIADGQTLWSVYPDSNEYAKVPQGRDGSSLVNAYSKLDQVRGLPKIVGHERAADADCTVVELAMEHNAKRTLWIDDTTHLIRQDNLDSGAERQETMYPLIRLGEKFDLQLFAYDPDATHARNRRAMARQAPVTLLGQPAPDFTLHDLDGREVRLSELRGKAVLLDFWGAWCGYCREALPGIEMIHRGLKDKGLVVFGIDSEEPETARDYLQKNGYTLTSLVDRKEDVVRLYHLAGWPTTVLVDRDGKVVYYGTGDDPQKLREALRAAGVW